MILAKTTLVAVMLLFSAGCNAEQEETTQMESFDVAVADGGPYAAPLPAGAKPKVEEPKKARVQIYIPGQDDTADADTTAEKPKKAAIQIYIPGQDDASDTTEDKAVEEDMVSDVGMSSRDRVAAVPKGKLKNPYTDDEEMIIAGKALYFGMSCNGCHGGGGGGGMCPPLSNEVFVYGSDDDTIFRLITLGTDDLAKLGYYRTGMEGVVGPMPPFGDLIEKDEDMWKIIAWMRTIFNGDPKRRNW